MRCSAVVAMVVMLMVMLIRTLRGYRAGTQRGGCARAAPHVL